MKVALAYMQFDILPPDADASTEATGQLTVKINGSKSSCTVEWLKEEKNETFDLAATRPYQIITQLTERFHGRGILTPPVIAYSVSKREGTASKIVTLDLFSKGVVTIVRIDGREARNLSDVQRLATSLKGLAFATNVALHSEGLDVSLPQSRAKPEWLGAIAAVCAGHVFASPKKRT